MSKIITQEIYEEEIKKINPNIRVRGRYSKAKTPIEHECLLCGNIWNARPNNIKNGNGCPNCAFVNLSHTKMDSHEDFIFKHRDSFNPSVEIVGKYNGWKESIECKCLICNQSFTILACTLAQGCGHKECSLKSWGETISKTPEYFEKEILICNPGIKLREKYFRSYEKIECECLVCGYVWKVLPQNLRKGRGCPKCADKVRSTKRMLSSEDYISRLQIVNPYVVSLEEYKGSNYKITHRCLKHMCDWKITPSNALKGKGCKYCLSEKISNALLSMTSEEYIERLKKDNPNVVALEDFKGVSQKILHKYLSCGHEAYTTPTLVLQGCGCNICVKKSVGKNFQKTHEEYIRRLKDINPYIIPLEEYIQAQTKIKHKCLIDGYEWYTTPTSALSGHGCPICNLSHGEREISKYLDSQMIHYIPQYSYDGLIGIKGGLLSYDFYISSYNLLIEYQGEQHELPIFGEQQLKVQQEHDRRKREYAKQHGFKLLEIWYYDYDNIEKILKDNLNLLSVETTGIIQ